MAFVVPLRLDKREFKFVDKQGDELLVTVELEVVDVVVVVVVVDDDDDEDDDDDDDVEFVEDEDDDGSELVLAGSFRSFKSIS